MPRKEGSSVNFYVCENHVIHQPVMVKEVLDYLLPERGGVFLDCTFGAGGHARALLEALKGKGTLIGVEIDPELVRLGEERFAGVGNLTIVEGNYKDSLEIVRDMGMDGVDGVLLDLGFSSFHVDASGRGFTFRGDEELDMRYSPARSRVTAREVVNTYPEEALAEMIKVLGEEREARKIARAIVRVRKKTPIRTSGELAAVVRGAVREAGGRRRIDPATRTFQALRIFVNRELENLEEFLKNLPHLLNPGGRAVVISYHSLEDRLVKTYFKKFSGKCVCPPGTLQCACGKERMFEVLTPKPVVPAREEVAENPRARSAKLRAAVKKGGER